MLRKYVIHFDPYRFERERYNVQEWRSLSDVNPKWEEGDWCYCGFGRFCATLEAALEWVYANSPDGMNAVIEYENCG